MKKEGGVNGSHAIEHCPLHSAHSPAIFFLFRLVGLIMLMNLAMSALPRSMQLRTSLMIFGRSQSCFASQFSMHWGGHGEKEEGRMDPMG